MDGTPEELRELLALKLDLDDWMGSLQNLDNWQFPHMKQALNVSLFKIQNWMEKANCRAPSHEDSEELYEINRQAGREPFRIGPPDEETLALVVVMFKQLRAIWSAMVLKLVFFFFFFHAAHDKYSLIIVLDFRRRYAEAVIETSRSMGERFARCRGLVDIKDDEYFSSALV